MADFPALPFWTDAYLADTRHLTTLEHGAYVLLLIEAWRRPTCTLPDDDAYLARLAGCTEKQWAGIRATVMAFWKRDGRSKTWTQKRLSAERMYVADKRKVQKDNAVKRWKGQKNAHATAMPTVCQIDAPTPTPLPLSKDKGATDPEREFWAGAKTILPASFIGKLLKDFPKQDVREAITRAQVERAMEPRAFVMGCLKAKAKSEEWVSPC